MFQVERRSLNLKNTEDSFEFVRKEDVKAKAKSVFPVSIDSLSEFSVSLAPSSVSLLYFLQCFECTFIVSKGRTVSEVFGGLATSRENLFD